MDSGGADLTGATDREILDLLRAASAKSEPVPPLVVQAARAAFVWRRIDQELAELTSDSASDLVEAAGVRGADEGRLLTFEVDGGLAIELQVVAAAADGLRILGQLVPPQAGEARVLHPAGTTAAAIDEFGRFAVREVAPGPVRIEFQLVGDEPPIVTDPVLL